MDLIRKIIREEVEGLILEASHKSQKLKRREGHRKYNEDQERRIMNIFNKLQGKYHDKSEYELARMAEKIFDKLENKRKRFFTRKLRGGGKERVSRDEYDSKNLKSSAANAEQIRTRVDQENTDIAAVARKVFPHHTDEGAQSQLRKVLNGDRPMTKRVASILSDMISSGQIAVKKD